MLNGYRRLAADRPFQGWLLMAAVTLALDLVLFAATVRAGVSRSDDPVPFGILAFSGLAFPTLRLIWRFSEEGRRERPIRPGQERAAGAVSLGLLALSVPAACAAAAGIALAWPRPLAGWAGVVTEITVVLSGALGYAARGTAAGRWGMRLACAWFALLFVAAFAASLVGRHALGGHA